MKRQLLPLLPVPFFLLFAFSVSAQALTGTVADTQTGNPLAYATVSLFSWPDSALVDGTITDENGQFTLTAKPGNYYAKMEFLAYEPEFLEKFELKEGVKTMDLGEIRLRPEAAMLNEVVVQAEKSTMQMALDKRIFNVGKDLANAGGNAADILSNIPSVSVDVEGNVSLRGSGNVRILIDGKPSGLVSFKGSAGLQQLQGNLIERVEIITNPSARYEAEGVGGIINIILKKERTQGLNGAFDLIAGNPTNFGGAVNLNYRKQKLNFFVNYGVTYRDIPGEGSTYQAAYRNDTAFIYNQFSDRSQTGFYNSIRGGLDYYFNPKNILTAAYTRRISKGKRNSRLEYQDALFTAANISGINVRTQDETEIEPNSEYSVNFKRLFEREGHELTAEVRYLDNWEDSDQDFSEQYFLANYSPSGIPDLLQHSYNFETEKQLLFQLDYVKPFGKDGKFETGLRSNFRDMTNDYLVEELNDGVWQKLPGLENNFFYDENIHGAYAILGNKIRKFSYQFGLRAEITDVRTRLEQTNEVNPRNYANLFPSVHFTYDLPADNAVQISYSRRIRRPRYNDLSPFVTYFDDRNYFSGNPDLEPEFTNSFELGHIKYMENAALSSSLYYRHTTGKIERIRRVDDEGNAATRPENLSTEDAFGLEITASWSPFKWWKTDGNFNFFRAVTDGGNLGAGFQSDTYSWFTRLTSRFTFWKNTDLQARCNYEARMQTPQGYRKPLWYLDLAASKDFLKDNATITVNVSDLFNTQRFRSVTEGDNFYTYSDFQRRPTQVNLTLSYRLHQQKKKGPPPGESGEGF
ncbi:MAG TPA: TonB-dependent receptor [Flavilitoribacter sp.]|nr:TonB-dependent receptor [Flavilitoribacter sp.]HMQ88430.1 TonB-dependent receptor [Flavilitoribacter sp.]